MPALPLLVSRSDASAVLIDASQKRCSFLVWAANELGLAERVTVWCGRAEEIGHEVRARRQFDVVVARGFGPPSMTIECAAPLTRHGGRVIVSEPPHPRPWPSGPLRSLGLSPAEHATGIVFFTRVGEFGDEFPRSMKSQRRRPILESDDDSLAE